MNERTKQVAIADTTLRDGEQAPGCHLTPDQKVEIAKQLHKMKVDVIEAGFPYSSPAEFESVSRIAAEVGRAEDAPVIMAFGRCVEADIQACWDSVKAAKRPRIHVFIASSDIHLKHKLRKTRAEAIDQAVRGVRFAKRFTPEVQFTPEDSSRADRVFLAQMIEDVIDAGATMINIADTVGYATPAEFADLIAFVRQEVPNIAQAKLSVHCHDDLGMAVANSLAAVMAGIDQIECTMNGIGERAGNCSLEEVAMGLRTRADFYKREINLDTKEIYPTSRLVARRMGMAVQDNKAIVGKNAFAHASGIHQDGVLKNPLTYEIMRAADIGAPGTSLPLTNRSGRSAVRTKLNQLGYNFSKERFEFFFERFKIFADGRRFVSEDEMKGLVNSI